jgi:hypothetical protein
MRNLRLIFVPFVIIGCGPRATNVFVDLDLVTLTPAKAPLISKTRADISASPNVGSRMIPGEPEKVIENLKANEKAAIRREVERETDEAIQTISGRLLDYYSREIDDFYKEEFAKLVPYKSALLEEYFRKIRVLFEAAAAKRGPLLTRLWLLTDGPPPVDPVPLDAKGLSKYQEAKMIKIRALQDEIAQIDDEYVVATLELEAGNLREIDKEFDTHQQNYEAKKREIDQRAAAEATRLVRRFSSGLSQRIFSKYTFQLKEIPTKTVNFPKMAAQSGIPRVTFDRNQLVRNERAQLTKELEAFLSLNHYQRVVEADGAKDVTQEFIEWRTNLKSGHWETWQKSSAPK